MKDLRYEYIEPHIKLVTGRGGYKGYCVSYHNHYVQTVRMFKTLEEAQFLKRLCNDMINKARLSNTCKNYDEKYILEYPETLLKAIGILPENCANYYTEILPDFEKNWEEVKKHLDERQVRVLDRYKNLETLEDVANMLNITRERVRQIECKALNIIRHSYYKLLTTTRDRFAIISQLEREAIIAEYKEKIAKDFENMTYEKALEIVKAHEEDKSTAIEDLDFSVRTYNCLRRAGISTISELSKISYDELLKVRNLGKKSAREIVEKLHEMGIEIPLFSKTLEKDEWDTWKYKV